MRAPGWRDPRLWVGLLVVTLSVVLGARVVGAADRTIEVWSVAGDHVEGDVLAPEDLVVARVHLAEASAGYLRAQEQLPAVIRLTRAVADGELLPRAAVGAEESGDERLRVPIAVDAHLVPPSVAAGSVVDVYLESGRPALSSVPVVESPALDAGFAATGRRQLVLAVDEGAAHRFFRLLGSLDQPTLTVVRRG